MTPRSTSDCGAVRARLGRLACRVAGRRDPDGCPDVQRAIEGARCSLRVTHLAQVASVKLV